MKLALGCCLCVLCAGLTVSAQVVPSTGRVSPNLLSAAPEASSERVSRPNSVDVEKQIDETERALKGIKRPLDAEEQTTVAQVRTFIRHAREALKYDDLEGANALSTKARVLLLELCRECRPHQQAKLTPI